MAALTCTSEHTPSPRHTSVSSMCERGASERQGQLPVGTPMAERSEEVTTCQGDESLLVAGWRCHEPHFRVQWVVHGVRPAQ
jgi:hypothetical protein